MSLDYSSITSDFIKQLNPDDPELLNQLNCTPLQDYSNLSDNDRYNQLKNQFIKLLVISYVIEYQREQALNLLKACKPVIKSIDNDELSK